MPARFASVIFSVLFFSWLNGQASAAEQFFSTRAAHAIIMDYETSTVLYDKNAYAPIPPASMSKLMTLAVVFDYLKRGEITLDTEFYVSKKAWRTGGSKMFVLVDSTIKVRDLLKGIIVASGNDACIVVAENISAPRIGQVSIETELGSEAKFVTIMNSKAREWGLANSTFANPTGLPDPEQLMSMYDLAMLASHIITTYSDYYPLFGLQEFTWSKITQNNRNPLLAGFDGADGMKTGHTEDAGFGVVGTAFLDGKRRIVVLAGLESQNSRAREANRMMGLAFSEFDSRTFFMSGDWVGEAEVFMGREGTVPLKIKSDVRFTTHRRALAGAKAHIVYQGPLKAPIRAEQQVALLRVELPGEPAQEYPLYTMENVNGMGFFGKLSVGLQALLTPPSATDIQ